MSDPVREFYDSDPEREWARLEQPFQRLEFAVGLRLIERYFPPRGRVADIGGGPGRYTIELLKRGYAATLLDLSPRLLEVARQRLAQAGLRAERLIEGDARDLHALETAGFDAALLMGPLYHLVEAEGRARALRELARVLKPGAVAIVTYLNSWGLLRTGLADFPERFRDAGFLRSMLGEQVFRGRELAGFTESYWSTPPAALSELRAAGFEIIGRASAQGFAGGMLPVVERLAATDPAAYASVLEVVAETCELPQYRDAGDHLHVIVRKPPGGQPGAVSR